MLKNYFPWGIPPRCCSNFQVKQCMKQKLNLMAHEVLTSVWTRREIKVNSDSVRLYKKQKQTGGRSAGANERKVHPCAQREILLSTVQINLRRIQATGRRDAFNSVFLRPSASKPFLHFARPHHLHADADHALLADFRRPWSF
jgi:hypothetical protein